MQEIIKKDKPEKTVFFGPPEEKRENKISQGYKKFKERFFKHRNEKEKEEDLEREL